MDPTCSSPDIHPYDNDVQDVPDDIALSSDDDLDSMMAAMNTETKELKDLRQQRDELPPPHEVARLVARVSIPGTRHVPGVVHGARRGGISGHGAFLLYQSPTSTGSPAPSSETVMARFTSSPSRLWLTFDGLISNDDVDDFRAGRRALEELVPGNAFAISVAGWSQLGYLHIEAVEYLQSQYDKSKPTWLKQKCVFLTQNALQGAKDSFATADRLEFVLAHPTAT